MVVARLLRIVGAIKCLEINPLPFRLKFGEPPVRSHLKIKRLIHHINAEPAPCEVSRATAYPAQYHTHNIYHIEYNFNKCRDIELNYSERLIFAESFHTKPFHHPQ